VSISARTLYSLITDIQHSLRLSGTDRLVIINGHGGNYVLQNIVQEATVTGTRMALFPAGVDWSRARTAAHMTTDNHQDMHAGELETPNLLDAHPDLVTEGYENADHIAEDRQFLLTIGMSGYTTSGVIGRPSLATAAKGQAALASLVVSFSQYLDLLTADLGTCAMRAEFARAKAGARRGLTPCPRLSHQHPASTERQADRGYADATSRSGSGWRPARHRSLGREMRDRRDDRGRALIVRYQLVVSGMLRAPRGCWAGRAVRAGG
jgi:hypothetical protein